MTDLSSLRREKWQRRKKIQYLSFTEYKDLTQFIKKISGGKDMNKRPWCDHKELMRQV